MTKSKTLGFLTAAVLAVAGMGSASAKSTLDRAQVRAKLAAHRAVELERLAAYEKAGQFPHDLAVAPSLHMFRDKDGRYCAVANLVHLDGHDDLVANVVKTHNDLAIADVNDGPLADWILESGLTKEELAFVQKPAPQVMKPRPQVPSDDPLGGETEAEMNAEMVKHLEDVKTKLAATADASLETAVDRYLVAHQ